MKQNFSEKLFNFRIDVTTKMRLRIYSKSNTFLSQMPLISLFYNFNLVSTSFYTISINISKFYTL